MFILAEKYYPQKEEENIIQNLKAKGYTYAPLNANVPNRNQNNYFYESDNLMLIRKFIKMNISNQNQTNTK